MSRIHHLRARPVLDSRGNPTVEVDVVLEDGAFGRAAVPSGASTGKYEALELRDQDSREYFGRGVTHAVSNIERVIRPEVIGVDAQDQQALDEKLIALDGAESKKRLGGNAILGVSLAVAKAAAASAGLPLFGYLGGIQATELPLPMVNILSGGAHGGGNMDFQDFLVIPLRAASFSDALQDAVAVFRAMKDVLRTRGVLTAGVADEGGYAPKLEANETGLELMVEAIERANLKPGKDAAIAVDVAASQFEQQDGYHLRAEGVIVESSELIRRLERWAEKYPVISLEDALGEEDWSGWRSLTSRLSHRCQLIGDDIFVTHPERLLKGVREGVANSILIKTNQIGTLTETLRVMFLARRSAYEVVVSARSGETEDDFMADLAVATGAGQIKIGSVTRSERLAKYNRLLRIEETLGDRARYRGAAVFDRFRRPQGAD
ncbi:MAG TPA: phosphopyruvate hydratase [Terriglobia bacterium]|nr:phosphopyruvate hydratase [Terriglobia bacterium]